MRKRIKIWFHPGATSDIKEFSIHKAVLWGVLFVAVSALAGTAAIGYDYYRLKNIAFDTTRLNQTLVQQDTAIKHQRGQIQSFAGEIETLKKQLDNLSKFETQVRLIAGIQQTSDAGWLIGIGGIPQDELDPDIPLEQKHTALIREMHQQANQTNLAAQKQALDFENLIQLLEQKRNLLASCPSIKPVDGWITSKFGYRASPFTGRKEFHSGLDISNKSGTKIVATANGRVSYASGKRFFGNLVVIDHGHGRITKYAHLKKILVKPGQKVKRGEVIATLGNTGRSTGPHVHYEIQLNGTPVNPLKYFLN